MKRKLTFAAIAAAVTMTALPAAASHDWDRDDYRYRGRPQHITVRTEDGGSFRTYPGERMHRVLSGNPFKFKPGRIYTYRDCSWNGNACDVLVTDPYGRQRYNRIVAPSIDRYFAHGGYGRGWGR
ncbi:MAG TPA: hypothetical protein VEA80_10955 [Vitreimonas sp.]|uniref:hypothetical protein n=1 Tax=Vitreimonas sp. TaxID=3069702 RepID=UPI002D410D0B|nr:hypothetical protein [Vitreimonas sp.]HYD87985.1 hypothetical protein [Vitreimonas sp.]